MELGPVLVCPGAPAQLSVSPRLSAFPGLSSEPLEKGEVSTRVYGHI